MNELSERKGRKRDKKVVDIDITDLYLIFQYLQRTDKNNIRLVCKYFNNIITQIDKKFYVLKVDLGIENCLTLSVAIRSGFGVSFTPNELSGKSLFSKYLRIKQLIN